MARIVVERSPERLVVTVPPAMGGCVFFPLWALLFAGIPLLLVGIVLFSFESATLVLDRSEPRLVSATVEKRVGFVWTRSETARLDRVDRAKLEIKERRDSDGDTITEYQVVLVGDGRELPFGEFRSRGPEKTDQANRINGFLGQPSEKTLRLTTSDSPWVVIFVVGLAVVFDGIALLVMFALMTRRTLTFDRGREKAIQHSAALGFQWSEVAALRDVKACEAVSEKDSDGDDLFKTKILIENPDREWVIDGGAEETRELAREVTEFLERSRRR